MTLFHMMLTFLKELMVVSEAHPFIHLLNYLSRAVGLENISVFIVCFITAVLKLLGTCCLFELVVFGSTIWIA